MANSVTSICNQALGVISAKRINDFDSDTSPRAQWCREFYESDRDALLRSHRWRFAAARANLSQDTVDPVLGEFDSQFILPSDFMAIRSIFGDNFTATGNTRISFAIEGQRILTNESSVPLRYTKRVTDPTEFDSLFVKVLVYTLADDLIGAVAGGDAKIQKKIDIRLARLLPRVRAMDRNETNTIGREAHRPWAESHVSGGGTSFRGRV
jgi:hypothetical protein